MEESVYTTQVDEGAKVGDVLDNSFPDLPFLELLDDLAPQALALLFENSAAGHDDIAPRLVEFDDLEIELLTQELVEVLDLSNVDLRTGQERFNAKQIDDDATLDAALQPAANGIAGIVGILDLVPHTHEVGFLLGQDNPAFEVLHVLQENLDL